MESRGFFSPCVQGMNVNFLGRKLHVMKWRLGQTFK